MRRRGMSKMNLFFLECIMSVVMFGLASLVILQAFIKVEQTRIQSQEEMQALVVMCSIAEYIQVAKPEVPEQITWYYNAEGNVIQEGEAPYFEVALTRKKLSYEGGCLQNYTLNTYAITRSKKKPVGKLTFVCYTPDERSEQHED